jgi:predicted GNAT family acetyltransferase
MADMNLVTYPEVSGFLSAAGGLFQSAEVRYSLIYSIARRIAINPRHYGEEEPWFSIVFEGNTICTLAWRTPPYLVGLAWQTGDAEEAVSLLAESIHARWKAIPGVTGHREVADLFASRWSRVFGAPILSTMSQRIYRLDSVDSISAAPGHLRLANPADKHLISAWTGQFRIDINEPAGHDVPEREINRRIEEGEVYLWEDGGQPVSMAAKTRPTDRGMTIGSVYTPPNFRRQGYATSCVAAVCREILKSGYAFCTLYTDLSNPTSNSIYMKIGFKPVCDSVQHTFAISGQSSGALLT